LFSQPLKIYNFKFAPKRIFEIRNDIFFKILLTNKAAFKKGQYKKTL